MWIRSQNKEVLKDIHEFIISKDFEICSTLDTKVIFLGTYKSKERAIEVVDAIQAQLRTCVSYDQMGQGVRSFKETVYEMPQE